MSGRRRNAGWFLHPAFRGEDVLDLEDAGILPAGGPLWVRSDAAAGGTATVAADGPHAQLARLLLELNDGRPGAVAGWYVVVSIDGGRWAVGQLRADSVHPVQLFEDLVFPTTEGAFDVAQRLRGVADGSVPP